MLYWVTGAINSSFWPYYARRHEPWPMAEGQRIAVPTAYAAFPAEILHPPRAWAERAYNITRWTADARRRPLRRAGGAGSARDRHPRILPPAPLAGG